MTEPMGLPGGNKSAGPCVFGEKAKKRDLDHSNTSKGEIMIIILGILWTINQYNTSACRMARWNHTGIHESQDMDLRFIQLNIKVKEISYIKMKMHMTCYKVVYIQIHKMLYYQNESQKNTFSGFLFSDIPSIAE